MLVDVQYASYTCFDEDEALHLYEYRLTDSEFGLVEGEWHHHRNDIGISSCMMISVVTEYGKRKLDVAANLVRVLLFLKRKHLFGIEEQMAWWSAFQSSSFTPELKAELNKYLALVG